MRKFQDAYRDAVKELPQYYVDVEKVISQSGEKESARSTGRQKQYLKLAATAAALFLLCGVGTATAMNYQKSKITVSDTGYSVAGPGVMMVSEDEFVVDITDTETSADYKTAEVLETETIEPVTYESLEEFWENETITVAIPDSELLGMEFEIENIMVMKELPGLMVRLQEGERIFALRQQDNREYKQYASSTTYMGESVNERNLINEQGLAYVVFDTMEEGKVTATHAVISVNGRDLSLNFYGFEQETVEKVLAQLDLSIYFQDE